MKRTLLHLLFAFVSITGSNAQTIECGGGVFYGVSLNNAIYKLTLSGNTISLNGVVVPAQSVGLNSLAIARIASDTDRFYSSGSPAKLLSYTAGQWQIMFTDTAVFHNAAGNDNALYYQQLGTPDLTKNRISRFSGNSLTLMWNDPVPIPVSDIAVDPDGNVYFFTGQTGTQVLHVMAPSGVITASYPTPFSNTTPYGCLFMDGTLYVGVGALNSVVTNKLLIPITFSGGTATVGQGIQMPAPVIGGTVGNPTYLDFRDLANCHPRNTLPVTLVAFNAERLNISTNILSWKVTNEVDMKYYEPEYSRDGIHFTAVDKLIADAPGILDGSYTYRHKASLRGDIYYRLKLTDKQGRAQYSKVVRLAAPKEVVGLVYPNPAKDKLYVEYTGKASSVNIKIADAFGRVVYTTVKAAASVIPLDLHFAAGHYVLTMGDGQDVAVRKFVKE